MRKKFLSVLLALTMVLTLLPTAVFAATPEASTQSTMNVSVSTENTFWSSTVTGASLITNGKASTGALTWDDSDSQWEATVTVTGQLQYVTSLANYFGAGMKAGYYLPINFKFPSNAIATAQQNTTAGKSKGGAEYSYTATELFGSGADADDNVDLVEYLGTIIKDSVESDGTYDKTKWTYTMTFDYDGGSEVFKPVEYTIDFSGCTLATPPETTKSAMTVSIPAQTAKMWEEKGNDAVPVDKLIASGVAASETKAPTWNADKLAYEATVKVTGEIYYVEGDSSGAEGNNIARYFDTSMKNGNFLPIQFDLPSGVSAVSETTVGKSKGQNEYSYSAADLFGANLKDTGFSLVEYLGSMLAEKKTSYTMSIDMDGDGMAYFPTIYTIDFSEATLDKKAVDVSVTTPENGTVTVYREDGTTLASLSGDASKANAPVVGEKLIVVAVPDEGYSLSALTATYTGSDSSATSFIGTTVSGRDNAYKTGGLEGTAATVINATFTQALGSVNGTNYADESTLVGAINAVSAGTNSAQATATVELFQDLAIATNINPNDYVTVIINANNHNVTSSSQKFTTGTGNKLVIKNPSNGTGITASALITDQGTLVFLENPTGTFTLTDVKDLKIAEATQAASEYTVAVVEKGVPETKSGSWGSSITTYSAIPVGATVIITPTATKLATNTFAKANIKVEDSAQAGTATVAAEDITFSSTSSAYTFVMPATASTVTITPTEITNFTAGAAVVKTNGADETTGGAATVAVSTVTITPAVPASGDTPATPAVTAKIGTITVAPANGYEVAATTDVTAKKASDDTSLTVHAGSYTDVGAANTYWFYFGGDETKGAGDSNVNVTVNFKSKSYAITNAAKKSSTETDPFYARYLKLDDAATFAEELTSAKTGDTVYVFVTKDSGYELDTISVTPTTAGAGAAITATKASSGAYAYSFTMPAYAVTVTASFKQATYPILLAGSNDVTKADGSTVKVSKVAAAAGEVVTITPQPAAGQVLTAITAGYGSSGSFSSNIAVTKVEKLPTTLDAGTAYCVTGESNGTGSDVAIQSITLKMPSSNIGDGVQIKTATFAKQKYALTLPTYGSAKTDGSENYATFATVTGATTEQKKEATYTQDITVDTEITVTAHLATATAGVTLMKVTYTVNGKAVEATTANGGSTYTFKMPASASAVTVTFVDKPFTVTQDTMNYKARNDASSAYGSSSSLTFVAGSASVGSYTYSATAGVSIKAPQTPAMDGYTFDGWEVTGGTTLAGASQTIATVPANGSLVIPADTKGDLTLTPMFTKKATDVTLTALGIEASGLASGSKINVVSGGTLNTGLNGGSSYTTAIQAVPTGAPGHRGWTRRPAYGPRHGKSPRRHRAGQGRRAYTAPRTDRRQSHKSWRQTPAPRENRNS